MYKLKKNKTINVQVKHTEELFNRLSLLYGTT